MDSNQEMFIQSIVQSCPYSLCVTRNGLFPKPLVQTVFKYFCWWLERVLELKLNNTAMQLLGEGNLSKVISL